MKTLIKITGLMICLALIAAPAAFAGKQDYTVISVSNGGSLAGSVLFKGPAPKPIMENLNKGKNAEFCAGHPDTQDGGIRPRSKVTVTDGKLMDTVIFIENITQGKDWADEAITFNFQNCDIFPKVSVVRKTPKGMKQGLVKIINQDPNILHNPHGYSKIGANAKTLFNKPLPNKGDVADVTKSLKRLKMNKDTHFFLQCDQHNYMEADARVVWNPYYAVTTKDGAFLLDQIPAGSYRVTAWHPYIGEVTQTVTIQEGQKARLDFQLSAK